MINTKRWPPLWSGEWSLPGSSSFMSGYKSALFPTKQKRLVYYVWMSVCKPKMWHHLDYIISWLIGIKSIFLTKAISDCLTTRKRLTIEQININHCWVSVSTAQSHTHPHVRRHSSTRGHTHPHTHTGQADVQTAGIPSLFMAHSIPLLFTAPSHLHRGSAGWHDSLRATPPTGYTWLQPDLTQGFYGPVTQLGLEEDRARWRAEHIKRSSSSSKTR